MQLARCHHDHALVTAAKLLSLQQPDRYAAAAGYNSWQPAAEADETTSSAAV